MEANNNPYAEYKKQAMATLAPGEVLVKLFDELNKQCRLSLIGMEKKDYSLVNESLTKAQTIVSTLASSLDMRFPISKDLRALYIFLAQSFLKANLRKNPKIIHDCIPLIKDLRDSFDQAEKISRREHATGMGGQAV